MDTPSLASLPPPAGRGRPGLDRADRRAAWVGGPAEMIRATGVAENKAVHVHDTGEAPTTRLIPVHLRRIYIS